MHGCYAASAREGGGGGWEVRCCSAAVATGAAGATGGYLEGVSCLRGAAAVKLAPLLAYGAREAAAVDWHICTNSRVVARTAFLRTSAQKITKK